MRKLFILLLFSVVFGNILLALEFEQPGSYVPGELLVKLAQKTSSATSPASITASITKDYNFAELNFERELSARLNIWLVRYNNRSIDELSILKQLTADPRINMAQLNHYIEERETPDDTMFPLQWNMHNTGQSGGVEDADIDATEAWDINVGGVCANGDTVIIAIVDSGCDLLHDDLNLWKNEAEIPGNGIDDDNNGYVDDYDGWNAVSHSGNVTTSSHGTHVAGIAGAIGDNGLGVAGVNWNAKIMPIRGSTSLESVAVEAYSYVHEMRSTWNETNGAEGAFVVTTNSSFGVNYGNPDNYPIWASMYDEMGEIGIISATATMNINADVDAVGDMPTSCDSEYMISVTNTTDADVKNGGAAYGLTTIDLGAPGTTIRSTNYNNGYSNKTGTSMATPHVAGAIAYLISAAPLSFLNNYLANPAEGALQIRDYILQGVDPLTDLEGETVTGGRLNIYNSLMLFESGGISGTISSDTTWDGSIDVVGDITISDGVTLTINPGTEVTFADNYEIEVEGRILSLGNEESMVEFSPADTLIGWNGVRFNSTSTENDSSLFYYTKFENAVSTQDGAALAVNQFHKVGLYNCSFESNKTISNGGAIHLYIASIHIENCIFRSNLAYGGGTSRGGAIVAVSSSPSLYTNYFHNNLAQESGGAIWLESCFEMDIINSMFEANIAEENGGALATEMTNLAIVNSTFKGNFNPHYTRTAGGGAMFFSNSEFNLINNLVISNVSGYAGAISSMSSDFNIINNTFAGNTLSGENEAGHVMRIENSSFYEMSFINNIIWDNGIDSNYNIALYGENTNPDFFYNNIQHGQESIWIENGFTFEGEYLNNIDADPVFTEQEPDLFALTQQSPSVNAGLPDMSSYEIPEFDLIGNPRIFAGITTRIDQGCYEYQGDGVRVEDSSIPVINGISSIYPNPFNPSTKINFNLKQNMLVKIEIFNLKGQKVKTVVNRTMDSGNHTVSWNGLDSNESPVSSGIYFSRMETSEKISIKKMMLLK